MYRSNQAARKAVAERLDELGFWVEYEQKLDADLKDQARERLGLPDPFGHPLGIPEDAG